MNPEGTITIDDFGKVDIRVGRIEEALPVEGSSKLLKLSVDFGEGQARTVVSGIAPYFGSPDELKGKKCAFVTNLEPRMLMGIESQAMILAARDAERFSLLEVPEAMLPGTKVG